MHADNLSRRRFLRNSALLGSGALLAACTAMPAPAAAPDADMAEAPVEVEFTVWGSWDTIYGLLMDHFYADANIEVSA